MKNARIVLALVALVLCFQWLEAQSTAPASPPPAAATPAPAPAAVSPEANAAAEMSKHQQKEIGQRFASGWGERLKAGGTTAIVQILLSVLGATFFFERLFNLRRSKIVPKGLARKARELWKNGEFEQLENIDQQYPSTLGRAIAWTARHRYTSYSDISISVSDIVSQELETSHQRIYPLGVVATLEPLMGLLGMILGMIQTFETVALAGSLGDPAQLAGGISEALVTTGLGLAIAIPFLALFHFFKSQTNMYGSSLEREMSGLLSEWFLNRDVYIARREVHGAA